MLSLDLSSMGSGRGRSERRRMSVADARPYLEEAAIEELFPQEAVVKEAIRVAEQVGAYTWEGRLRKWKGEVVWDGKGKAW
jgi:hypothetical protein